MIDDDFKDSILMNIELGGAASEQYRSVNLIIASSQHTAHILNISSGLPRFNIRLLQQFSLILSTPEKLAAMNPFQIRCCLCNRVISYPCWHHVEKYSVNEFHYFVCLDKADTSKPTTKCFRRT